MKVLTILRHPQEVIGKRWSEDQSPEQARILGLARDALFFISETGQPYSFEDFRKGLLSSPPVQAGDDFTALEERMSKTTAYFTQLLDDFYLAADHPNVNHRALYPLSMAEGYRDET